MICMLTRTDLHLAVVSALAIAWIGLQVHDSVHARRRRAARERRVAGRLRELQDRLWTDGAVCCGLEPGDGVLVARAVRAARAAALAADQARACVEILQEGSVEDGDEPPRVADLAVAAEARLEAKLDRLRRVLPVPAVAELEQAQAAWRDYRDRHVRLCRELPSRTADRWPVRHLASEAVTAARIDDLADLLAVKNLEP